MKITSSDLQKIAVMEDQYPQDKLPEIAFAGRSNVGKSSFINSMINRKNLARTSGKPGKTRTINFYLINNKFRFVDLPGYGYAKVSKKEKDKWAEIIDEYLSVRENLKEVAIIVDIRHKPSEQDLIMYEFVQHFGFEGIIIATKADKIPKGKIQKNIKLIAKELGVKDTRRIIPYSATTKLNSDKIWSAFSNII